MLMTRLRISRAAILEPFFQLCEKALFAIEYSNYDARPLSSPETGRKDALSAQNLKAHDPFVSTGSLQGEIRRFIGYGRGQKA